MEFLSARTPIVVASGVFHVVVPMVVIMLLALLLVLLNIRRRLEMDSAKTLDDMNTSEAVVDAGARVQPKRRTYRQRKRARKSGSAKAASQTPETSMATFAEVSGIDMAKLMDAKQTPICLEAGGLAHDLEEALIEKDHQIQNASDYEGISDEDCDIVDTTSSDQAYATNAVRARDRAPASCSDADIELVSPNISQLDACAGICSCASGNAWGCARDFVYSRSLLLAHREISLKIAKGPPGLELPEASTVAARIYFAARL